MNVIEKLRLRFGQTPVAATASVSATRTTFLSGDGHGDEKHCGECGSKMCRGRAGRRCRKCRANVRNQ